MGGKDRIAGLSFRESVVKVTAVRMTYEHIAASWRRFTAERRAGLLGELELLPLQLPEVQSPDDRDRRSSPPACRTWVGSVNHAN